MYDHLHLSVPRLAAHEAAARAALRPHGLPIAAPVHGVRAGRHEELRIFEGLEAHWADGLEPPQQLSEHLLLVGGALHGEEQREEAEEAGDRRQELGHQRQRLVRTGRPGVGGRVLGVPAQNGGPRGQQQPGGLFRRSFATEPFEEATQRLERRLEA